MNQPSNEEIETEMKRIWGNAEYDERLDNVKVERSKKHVDIQLSSMYHKPGLTFSQIEQIAAFFNTKNVETESEFSYSGCESCDYGSSYGFVLRVRDGDPVAS